MFVRIFLLFLFLSASSGLHAEIYKWVDENGQVHFGDRKKSEVEQKIITLDEVKPEWSKFEINITTTDVNLTPKERKHIVDGVNNVYEFFDRVLYFDIYKTVPANILILKNKEEYNSYLEQNGRGKLTSSYGIYFSKENQIIVYIRKNRSGTFRTIRHEVSHAIIDTIMPYTPAWLNEGLAEQMETLNRSEAGLYITPHNANRKSVNRASGNNNLTDISEFLKLPSRKWRHALVGGRKSLQGQAGQFVYFLLSTPPNRNFVIRLIHKFERGNRKLSYYLVNDDYIGGVKTLDITWRNWIKNQSTEVIDFF